MTATLDGCVNCGGDGSECPWCSVPDGFEDYEEFPYPEPSPFTRRILSIQDDDMGLYCTDRWCTCLTARLSLPDADPCLVLLSGAFRWTPDMPAVRFGAS
jgi:hypothetical protein